MKIINNVIAQSSRKLKEELLLNNVTSSDIRHKSKYFLISVETIEEF